jgi:hypothetical protein
MRGRSYVGFGGSTGNSGTTIEQSSSDTSGLLMPPGMQARFHVFDRRSKSLTQIVLKGDQLGELGRDVGHRHLCSV